MRPLFGTKPLSELQAYRTGGGPVSQSPQLSCTCSDAATPPAEESSGWLPLRSRGSCPLWKQAFRVAIVPL